MWYMLAVDVTPTTVSANEESKIYLHLYAMSTTGVREKSRACDTIVLALNVDITKITTTHGKDVPNLFLLPPLKQDRNA
jgi:hypothetical protein